jgi:hypothetical protein
VKEFANRVQPRCAADGSSACASVNTQACGRGRFEFPRVHQVGRLLLRFQTFPGAESRLISRLRRFD